MRLLAIVCFTAVCAACVQPIDRSGAVATEENRVVAPHTDRTALAPVPEAAASTISIGYGGGPVMLGTPDVYYIWYGNWSGNDATTILTDFIQTLGGSPYFLINTTYYDSQSRHVTGQVHFAGATTDAYSQGKSLSYAKVESVVSTAISSGALPGNENAVYFVLTSPDVTFAGFCSSFCGWHYAADIAGQDIKYSFVGNAATQCPSSCAPYSPSPNGNVGADGMASVVAHELEESITDPDLDAWMDSGGENGDKCAWKFGTTYTTTNGASANMKLGSRDFLIQENLDADHGDCTLELPVAPPPPPPGPAITVTGPADGSIIHPGGPLDFVASIVDAGTVTAATVNWTSPSGTAQFTLSKNAAGDWALATTLSTAAHAGTRSFTVTATDSAGQSATSPPVTLTVQ